MIKLVVCDLDGTLLPYGDEKLNSNTVERIKGILDKGIKFAVSSGRVYSELCEFLSDFRENIYFISSDGALMTYADKVIFHKPFSADAMNYAVCSAGKSVLRFFGKDKVWSFNDKSNAFPNDTKFLKPFEIKEPIYKIVSYGAPIPSFVGAYSRIHYSDGSIAEYVPPYANKGVTLGALQRHIGVSLYETVAIGDSVNDIPMMKNAKYSVAVGNSASALCAECKLHSETALAILEKVWLNADFNT